VIVDANVFKGFYDSVLGIPHTLSGCPAQLMAQTSTTNPIFHDDGKIIEAEWKQMVDPDWFEPWLASQLTAGAISYVKAQKDICLEKK